MLLILGIIVQLVTDMNVKKKQQHLKCTDDFVDIVILCKPNCYAYGTSAVVAIHDGSVHTIHCSCGNTAH